MICTCGGTHFTHLRTEHDQDGTTMRLRQCRNCHAEVAVEIIERTISVASFWGRAESHRIRNLLYERRTRTRIAKLRTCRHCQEQYRPRSYARHINTPEHLSALRKAPTTKSRARARKSTMKAYWKKRGVDLEGAERYIADVSSTAMSDRALENT